MQGRGTRVVRWCAPVPGVGLCCSVRCSYLCACAVILYCLGCCRAVVCAVVVGWMRCSSMLLCSCTVRVLCSAGISVLGACVVVLFVPVCPVRRWAVAFDAGSCMLGVLAVWVVLCCGVRCSSMQCVCLGICTTLGAVGLSCTVPILCASVLWCALQFGVYLLCCDVPCPCAVVLCARVVVLSCALRCGSVRSVQFCAECAC